MAHDHPPAGVPGHHADHAGAHGPGAHVDSHAGTEHHHPGWKTYFLVGFILTVITAVEVSAFYIPAWESSRIYVPSMLLLSTIKFVLVVMYYMHLKYDHRLFRALFTGSLIIAIVTIVALLFLFGKIAFRTGALI